MTFERHSMAFESVDAYIAGQTDDIRQTLARVRSLILAAVPNAEERIAYDMPTYLLNGTRFIHFAAWKRHYALYAINEAVRTAFREDLTGHDVRGSTVRFRYSDPIPEELILRLVRFRAQRQA